jgi:hypothetical protein
MSDPDARISNAGVIIAAMKLWAVEPAESVVFTGASGTNCVQRNSAFPL